MKILYVTTVSNTVNAFLIPHIKMLFNQGHHVDVAFNIVQDVDSRLIDLGCKVHKLEFERSPMKKQNYSAYKKLKKIISDEEYDIVHTHTPVASASARLACRKMDNVKVVYTAHGFHFYKGAPILNWILYYPVERLLSRYTDVLITINTEDYERAKGSFNSRTVEYLPGVGLEFRKLIEIDVDKSEKRREIGVPDDSLLILSVGELNKNKNHESIIKAMARLHTNNIYYVICGQGPMESHLKELSNELGIEKRIKFLGYRNDIYDLCSITDIFAFPSFREGLSVALMEAMASGLPIVCSDIRGNSDLIEHNKGGYLLKMNDIENYVSAIQELYKSKKLRSEYGKYNLKRIEKYSIENVLKKLEKIYQNLHV
ncbi:glycosyltransferase family 4 protein [Sutcliffiella horikoshii]|uniref:glycosyltransferase family 4 protein n=1 Tax=Sutcliffiella horikoshii TaxID=79883 RepID=UPI0038504309